MKVKIAKSSSEIFWYRNHIGEVYDIIDQTTEYVRVYAYGQIRNIGIRDCKFE
ncbi:hypothetical protein [Massilibacterium senegalense]|uniref:hypothetical protein n=1 Tax=Massilibacterium senegalense TaxID=1632858 RepID=UPI0012B66592|nr:hypothetical protein [Massilibacterium senegalense]